MGTSWYVTTPTAPKALRRNIIFVMQVRGGPIGAAIRIESSIKELKDMKWYYFGLLSLVVCILTGLLGWYIGGLESEVGGVESKLLASVVVAIVCVAFGVASCSRDFRRKFPDFTAYAVLALSSILIYAAAAIISHHRHLPLNLPPIE